MGVYARLLIEPPYALYVATITGIFGQGGGQDGGFLSPRVPWFPALRRKGLDLGLCKDTEVICGPLHKALEP